MGGCISIGRRFLLLFKRKGGAEYEKMESQLIPKSVSSTGLPPVHASSTTDSSDGPLETDPDFADWDESTPINITILTHTAATTTPTPNTNIQTHTPTNGRHKHTSSMQQQEEIPQPPPEPDFFGNMGMSITNVEVSRAALKKPLASSFQPASALHDPTRNIYATTTNAHRSRFTDDLVEEPTSSATAAWGDDDFGAMIGQTTATTSASASSSAAPPKRTPKKREPTVKKPRGIGAVAVQLDEA